jgi:hypothetical protein
MAFIDQYTLAMDQSFINRVQMAMVKSAISVCNESPAADYHQPRSAWATQVLRDPSFYAARVAFGVTSNPVITAQSSDSDIEFTVNSDWNAYAGVVTSA